MTPGQVGVLLLSIGLIASCQRSIPKGVRAIEVPEVPARRLQITGHLLAEQIREPSGIIQGRVNPSAYFLHNDSGDSARIFAISENGHLLSRKEGIVVEGATNRDWEDIAADDEGHLILADTGNNDNDRRDLGIYVIPEPDLKTGPQKVPVLAHYGFYYPDQESFPPPRNQRNFDSEALFFTGGKIYLLTKRRGDHATKLYTLDIDTSLLQAPPSDTPERTTLGKLEQRPLIPLDSFFVNGRVTAADVTKDGKHLAVLTYGAVWVFDGEPGQWLKGAVRWLPITQGKTLEALCITQDPSTKPGEMRLLLVNEEGEMFTLPTSEMLTLAGPVGSQTGLQTGLQPEPPQLPALHSWPSARSSH